MTLQKRQVISGTRVTELIDRFLLESGVPHNALIYRTSDIVKIDWITLTRLDTSEMASIYRRRANFTASKCVDVPGLQPVAKALETEQGAFVFLGSANFGEERLIMFFNEGASKLIGYALTRVGGL